MFRRFIKERFYRNRGNMTHNKIKRLSLVLIVCFSFTGMAFAQRPASSSLLPPTKLAPPAHGKIPVAFIIGRSAETIDFAGPWEAFYFAYRPSPGSMNMNGQDLHFEIHNGASTYDGKLNAEGTAIEGTWKQSGASDPLVLKRVKT